MPPALTIPAKLLTQPLLDELLINPESTKLSPDCQVLLDRIKEAGKEHKLAMCNQPLVTLIKNGSAAQHWIVYDGLLCLLWNRDAHNPQGLCYYARSIAQDTQFWLDNGIHRQFVIASGVPSAVERAAQALQMLTRANHEMPAYVLRPENLIGEIALQVSGSTLEQRLAESRGRFYYLFGNHLPDIPTPLNLIPDRQVQNPAPQIVPIPE